MIPDNIFNDVIEEIAGHDVISLVDLIKGKSNVSEFKIAEKLDITVNKVRNMLYRLDAYTLVEFTRKKDTKKGWYVYFWTLDLRKLRDLAVKRKNERIVLLKERIAREGEGEYFICPDKHVRMNLENAMEFKFRCQECDLPLVREDNQKVVASLDRQIERLAKDVETLQGLEIKPIAERKVVKPVQRRKKRVVKKKKLAKKKKIVKRKSYKKIMRKPRKKERIIRKKLGRKSLRKRIVKKKRR